MITHTEQPTIHRKLKGILTACLFTALCASSFAQLPQRGETYLIDGPAIDMVRHQIQNGDARYTPALMTLVGQATYFLQQPPLSVVDKTIPGPSGDSKDYTTIIPYVSPNPITQDGFPYIFQDGVINPEVIDPKYDRVRFFTINQATFALSTAYYFTGNEAFGQHAATLLKTWFLNPETAMNPNLRHAQSWPGLNDGTPLGIIRGNELLQMLDSSQLLGTTHFWTAQDQKKLKNWYKEYLKWMLKSDFAGIEEIQNNNHGSWFDVQVIALGIHTGRTKTAKNFLKTFVDKNLQLQVAPDTGAQLTELVRSDSLDYSHFNLKAYTTAAHLGQRIGIDIWEDESPSGATIKKAVEFLTPYATGQTWPFPQSEMDSGDVADLIRYSSYSFRQAFYRYGESQFSDAMISDSLIIRNHPFQLLYPITNGNY